MTWLAFSILISVAAGALPVRMLFPRRARRAFRLPDDGWELLVQVSLSIGLGVGFTTLVWFLVAGRCRVGATFFSVVRSRSDRTFGPVGLLCLTMSDGPTGHPGRSAMSTTSAGKPRSRSPWHLELELSAAEDDAPRCSALDPVLAGPHRPDRTSRRMGRMGHVEPQGTLPIQVGRGLETRSSAP